MKQLGAWRRSHCYGHGLLTTFVKPIGFRFCLPLQLAATPVLVVLASHSREHVEHHAVDGVEDAREIVGVRLRHHPRGRQVQRHHANSTSGKFGVELLPVGGIQVTESVNLFYEKDVARPSIRQEPEQFRTVCSF
jgi:hypothetical protein